MVFCHHRLFLWLPYSLHDFPLVCSQPGCNPNRLRSAGLFKTVRLVVDWVHDYYIGTEYLECGRCNKKVPGWSLDILSQLDKHQVEQFLAVVLYQLALDKTLLLKLRDRTMWQPCDVRRTVSVSLRVWTLLLQWI